VKTTISFELTPEPSWMRGSASVPRLRTLTGLSCWLSQACFDGGRVVASMVPRRSSPGA